MDFICYLQESGQPLIRPAEPTRAWMDAAPHGFAYRCSPLNMANANGWEILTPAGFTAYWSGGSTTADVIIKPDHNMPTVACPVSIFGQGVLTAQIPGLFRTPPGWNLSVGGSPNAAKDGIAPLAGIIETDLSPYTFPMNWRFTRRNHWVRFEAGEPICFIQPMQRNALESMNPRFVRLEDDPEAARQFAAWRDTRDMFKEVIAKTPPDATADQWQRRYYTGRAGDEVLPAHQANRQLKPFAAPMPADKAEQPSGPVAVHSINDEWRRWIAENLILEAPPERLVETLTSQGFAAAAAADAIDSALRSPYLAGALRLRNRLRKRDWMLAAYRKNNRAYSEAGVVPRRHKLPREAFFDAYYSANRPVIITGMMDDWPAMRKWNLGFLAGEYGDCEVEVQVARDSNADYEIEKEKHIDKIRFSDFIRDVRSAVTSNDVYMTAFNHSGNKAALAGLWDDMRPITEYLNANDAQAGFLWFGPAGTITPFHHDLTNNFMAQVMGRKRILLSPSWDMPLMQNHLNVYSRLDGRSMSARTDPELHDPRIIEATLNPGELLFIPIGWMHFVEAMDISLTITFTNFLHDNNYASFYTTYREV